MLSKLLLLSPFWNIAWLFFLWRCWTRLAERAGRIFRTGSFSSDRRRANISASGRWSGNNVGNKSAGFRWWKNSRMTHPTKYFAGLLTAVDVFYSIHKAAIFNAEQLILGITASRSILYGWKENYFRFWLLRIRSYLTKLNLTSALSSLHASTCVWSTSVYRSTPGEPVKKRFE